MTGEDPANFEDLGEVTQINGVEVYPYQSRAYQFHIEAKNNPGESYALIVDRRQNTEGGAVIADTVSPPVHARYIRLTVHGAHAPSYAGSWVSIADFQVLGTKAPRLEFEAEALSRTTSATAKVITTIDASNGAYVLLTNNNIGDWVEFQLPRIEAGTYLFTYRYRQIPGRGIAQTWTGGADLGNPVDQYGATSTYQEVNIGTRTFQSTGEKKIRFTVTGQHPSSKAPKISVDKIIMERQ